MEWSAFLDLKSRLASRPILRPASYDIPFCVATDASDRALGSVLFQVVDEIEHPVCYFSRKLNTHEVNYSTVEKEALSLVTAIRQFSVYFGSNPVTVNSDHQQLQFISKMAGKNQRILRWSLELEDLNINVIHRRGKNNILPDLLSRPPCTVWRSLSNADCFP